MSHQHTQQDERAQEAPRPVADASVREFIEVAEGVPLNHDYRITDWDRDQYRRVRKLFTREVTQ